MEAELQHRTVRSGGADIAVTFAGQRTAAAPIVFLHAGVCDSRMWLEQLVAFAPKHRVLAYDRRGFGSTRSPDEPFAHVSDLARVLDDDGADRAVLVGCSQGGRIAIDCALQNPAAAAALVLIAPAISGDAWPESFEPPLDEVIAGYERADEAGDADVLNEYEARVWLDGPMAEPGRVGGAPRELFLDMNAIALAKDASTPLSQEAEPDSALDRLGELTAPTLAIAGDLDFPHIVARTRAIADARPSAASFELLAGVAHLPSVEAAAKLNTLLAEFFDRVAT